MNGQESFAATSLPLDGLTIRKDGKELHLDSVERQKLLDTILDSSGGPVFDMFIDSPDQIFCLSCNNGNYNLWFRSVNKSERCALFGVSPFAMEGLKKAIAEAIAASPSPQQP